MSNVPLQTIYRIRRDALQRLADAEKRKSVQGKLMEVAAQIFKGERVDIQGSGRTDAGVHALNQVAHLDVKTMLAPEIIRMKFNDELPKDITILEVEKQTKISCTS